MVIPACSIACVDTPKEGLCYMQASRSVVLLEFFPAKDYHGHCGGHSTPIIIHLSYSSVQKLQLLQYSHWPHTNWKLFFTGGISRENKIPSQLVWASMGKSWIQLFFYLDTVHCSLYGLPTGEYKRCCCHTNIQKETVLVANHSQFSHIVWTILVTCGSPGQ